MKMDIQESIRQKLTEIEQQENVTILHAVESGSRSWGFASPDSDYDVRFIYVRRRNDYLRLNKTSDVIEWQLDETYDISGWDLQKMLTLLHQSNPTVFEWNHSPLIYRTTPFWEQIRPLIDSCFIEKKGLYHYLHMAKTNYREYLRGEPAVDELLAKKMQTPELGEGARIPELNDYLDRSITEIEALAEKTDGSRGADWALLNQMFLDGIAYGEA